jgi:hypothetical protein
MVKISLRNELDRMTSHITRPQLLKAFQSRAARIAVGASTVRGRGNRGAVEAAREYFCQLDLRRFANARGFVEALDQATNELRFALPPRARHWGLARKLLNIFLRDCLYLKDLNAVYRLDRVEAYLELPLDSITARALKKAEGRGKLPAWPGVKRIKEPIYTLFQSAATSQAKARGVSRVNLDAIWWSLERDANAV